MLGIGEKAPDFDLERIDGGRFHLAEVLEEKQVLLYFFPKNLTPL